MSHKLPDYFQLQYSRTAIAESVKELGVQISSWIKSSSANDTNDVICLPILRGGIFFFADIVRELDSSIVMAPIRSQAYQVGQNLSPVTDIKINIDGVEVKNRRILLVDDICDSGRTLQKLVAEFKSRGASEVKTAVLIKRDTEECMFDPDFVCFKYHGPEWFVGYGMDDGERWSNSPNIYIIKKNNT